MHFPTADERNEEGHKHGVFELRWRNPIGGPHGCGDSFSRLFTLAT